MHSSRVAGLGGKQRDKLVGGLSPEAAYALLYEWEHWARPEQLPPAGDWWNVWMYLGGRGTGKTKSAVQYILSLIGKGYRRVALVGPTAGDVRDVIVEGESGIMASSMPQHRPVYEPTKRRLTWKNGAIATTFSADEPDRLRGPQHDAAYCDELASWRYPESWSNLMFGLRLGAHPRCVVATTPRPTQLIRDLVARARTPANPHGDVAITRGTSYQNRANLAPSFFEAITRRYEGTRLGRQELNAELLEDVPGALWSRVLLDATRVKVVPELRRVVVAIDPASTSGEGADETGIIVAGKDDRDPPHGYVIADCSGRFAPIEWARVAIGAYRTHKADRIVAEVNNGGEMVEATLRMVDASIPFTAVHATRGKVVRAEPVAALYEQSKVHHLGMFPELEDQLCSYTSDLDRVSMGSSPDRGDALMWAIAELLVEPIPDAGIFEAYRRLNRARLTDQKGVDEGTERPLVGRWPG